MMYLIVLNLEHCGINRCDVILLLPEQAATVLCYLQLLLHLDQSFSFDTPRGAAAASRQGGEALKCMCSCAQSGLYPCYVAQQA
jgi:hypothetical protein